jgi:hypothetical protein
VWVQIHQAVTNNTDATTTRIAQSFHMPPPNTHFTGRSEHLLKLHDQMASHATVAVSHASAIGGLGGIGKTELAIQYVYQHWDPQRPVFWIQAENVAAEFTLLGEHLGIVGSDAKQPESLRKVKQWLADNDGWLLIFDNIDNIDDVRRFFPSHRHNGRILLTTHAQVFNIQTVVVNAMRRRRVSSCCSSSQDGPRLASEPISGSQGSCSVAGRSAPCTGHRRSLHRGDTVQSAILPRLLSSGCWHSAG